jgi:hypothetical protein
MKMKPRDRKLGVVKAYKNTEGNTQNEQMHLLGLKGSKK